MIEQIAELAARIKGDPALAAKVTETTDLINEIGLDSLQMIDFLLALEEEFHVEVDFEALDMTHLTRVGALCRFIENMQASSQNKEMASVQSAGTAAKNSEPGDDHSR